MERVSAFQEMYSYANIAIAQSRDETAPVALLFLGQVHWGKIGTKVRSKKIVFRCVGGCLGDYCERPDPLIVGS